MFEGHPLISVDGCCRDGDELLRFLAATAADVLLLDIQMKGLHGEQLARAVHGQFPGLPFIALTNIDHPFTARSIMAAGARGYLLKGADRDLLGKAIMTVHGGQFFIDEQMQGALLGTGGREQQLPVFTERELAVLELISRERTTKEIAAQLFISVSRVEACRMDLFLKLGVRNVAGLVRRAIQLGLIP